MTKTAVCENAISFKPVYDEFGKVYACVGEGRVLLKCCDCVLYRCQVRDRACRKLEGIVDDVNVWVTTEISNQLVPREKIRESPEVHVAGLCIKTEREGVKALIAKRNPNRKLYPSLYEGCGGQLKYSESFEDGVKRHYYREMQIDVQVVKTIHSFYEIRVPEEPLIPGIRFLCKYVAGDPVSKNHSDIRWVSEDELKSISENEFIPGLKDEFINFIERFNHESQKRIEFGKKKLIARSRIPAYRLYPDEW